MNKSRSSLDKKTYHLPNWLWPGSNALPQLYRIIWEAVREDRPTLGASQGELLVDTNRVFPLLLTSQLPTEVLGYIWSLANRKYAGQLTEQELYIILALIAIAQTSYTFSSLDVLHMLPGPPTPRLNLSCLYSNQGVQPQVKVQSSFLGSQVKSQAQISQSKVQAPSNPLPQVSQTAVMQAPLSSILQSQLGSSLTPATPSPQVQMYETIVPSSIINSNYIGENKLGQKNSGDPADFSDDFTEFQSAPLPPPTLPNLDPKQGSAIGSRLANHNLSGGSSLKKLGDKSKKSTVKIKMTSTNSLNFGSTKESSSPDRFGGMFPKCTLKNQMKTVVLKDTIIRNSEPPKSYSGKPPENVSKPSKVNKELESPAQDLMSLQPVEDKYSALRLLVDEFPPSPVKDPSPSKTAEKPSEPVDDFGDFVSAEQPELTSGLSQTTLDASMDLFSDFEQFLPSSSGDKEEISFAQETIEALAQLEITASPEKTLDFLEEKYETVMDPEKVIQKEDTLSVNSIELGNGAEALTRSGSVPSLDLKSFLPFNGDEEKEIESMYQLIYWEWKQYMENCVLLLQVALNIFTSVSSETVLQEVLNSAQGYNFLCNLAEVAAVCRRVNFSHKEMDINIMGFDDLLLDIDRIWAEMEPFYVNIPIVTELPVWPLHQGEGNTCALCLTLVTSGKITYNDHTYHATCANLWLNCVNNNLPALKYPSQMHSASTGSN